MWISLHGFSPFVITITHGILTSVNFQNNFIWVLKWKTLRVTQLETLLAELHYGNETVCLKQLPVPSSWTGSLPTFAPGPQGSDLFDFFVSYEDWWLEGRQVEARVLVFPLGSQKTPRKGLCRHIRSLILGSTFNTASTLPRSLG